MPMMDTTSYSSRPAGEIAREQACMRQVFSVAPPVEFIWEAFGGLGKTAQVLSQKFPTTVLRACDLDAGCVAAYNEGSHNGLCLHLDAQLGLAHLANAHWITPEWGCSLDYNKFTLMDLRGERHDWRLNLLLAVMARRPRWVQITDSAVRYLHLNHQRYGLPSRELAGYVEAFAAAFAGRFDGYRLTVSASHHAAAYMMFEAG